ncbi:MAG: DUF2282 domain-containing protein [Candidatus Thiodiazotropha sp. DIVDIV]
MNRITRTASVAGAITTALTLGQASNTLAADSEKCHGVAKAGKNDCKAGPGTSCAGSSTADAQANAWMMVLKGSCEKIVGGSLAEK